MRVWLIFLFLAALSVSTAYAQRGAKGGPASPGDSKGIVLRRFDQDRMDSYRQQRAFHYDKQVPQNENFLARLWRLFWETVYRALNGSQMGGAVKYVVWALGAVALVFLIVKVSGMDLQIFMRAPRAVEIMYTESEDNIHEIDFDQEIDRAVAQANYRVAVRLYYLYSLKKLNDRELISWQPDKTNLMYLRELGDEQKRAAFSRLTNRFEYIWYGGFGIGQPDFIDLKADFDRFNRTI
jgi:hypothetical protein